MPAVEQTVEDILQAPSWDGRVGIMDRTLFADPGADLHSKQDKVDTERGWSSVQGVAANGISYADFLHQRHYGGAFRQVLDATATRPRPVAVT